MIPLVLLQNGIVVVGTAWCIALASTVFFGGWYAHTHPLTGNDQVMRRLARLLRFLTFGLTDAPFPDPEGEDTSREAEKEPDGPARLPHRHVSVSS
jgi:hypothetical protein